MKTIIALLTATLLSVSLYGQGEYYTVTGRVVDEIGEPLLYAHIAINKQWQQIVVDADGYYNIQVPKGDDLLSIEVHSIGYKSYKGLESPSCDNVVANIKLAQAYIRCPENQLSQSVRKAIRKKQPICGSAVLCENRGGISTAKFRYSCLEEEVRIITGGLPDQLNVRYLPNILSGIVVDEIGEPLPYANIVVDGYSDVRTITDGDGAFTLQIPGELSNKPVVQVSSIGFEQQQFDLDFGRCESAEVFIGMAVGKELLPVYPVVTDVPDPEVEARILKRMTREIERRQKERETKVIYYEPYVSVEYPCEDAQVVINPHSRVTVPFDPVEVFQTVHTLSNEIQDTGIVPCISKSGVPIENSVIEVTVVPEKQKLKKKRGLLRNELLDVERFEGMETFSPELLNNVCEGKEITEAQQSRIFSGIVMDSVSGEPAPFVNVYLSEDETIGDATDFDGRFTFEIPAARGHHVEVVFSSLEYGTKHEQLDFSENLTINRDIYMNASLVEVIDIITVTCDLLRKPIEEEILECCEFVTLLADTTSEPTWSMSIPEVEIVGEQIEQDSEWLIDPAILTYGTGGFYQDSSVAVTNSVQLYPNPAADFVTIKVHDVEEGELRASLLNMSGQVLIDQIVQVNQTHRMDLPDYLPTGMYMVRLTNGIEFNDTHQLMIAR